MACTRGCGSSETVNTNRPSQSKTLVNYNVNGSASYQRNSKFKTRRSNAWPVRR